VGAGAPQVGAGALQAGAGAQHAGADEQHFFFLQPQLFAWAVSVHMIRPAEQMMAAAANFNMTLSSRVSAVCEDQTLASDRSAWFKTSAPVAGSTGSNRIPTYRRSGLME
jgi:hypothetical protein